MVLAAVDNVANNIAALGARAILMDVVGDDAVGWDTSGYGIEVPAGGALLVVPVPGRPTTLKTRFICEPH